MACTLLTVMIIAMLFILAGNYALTGVPSMRRLGITSGVLGVLMVVLLATGVLHSLWEELL